MDWFWEIWQHLPEHMDPVIFSIGNFKLQYYGLMYIVAFAITYMLVIYRINNESRFTVSREQVQDLTTCIILGLMIGARLGYVLFYHPAYYLKHPVEIILPFSFSDGVTFTGISGMSYHGGMIGVLIASFLYIRKQRLNFWEMTDLYVPTVPLGYTFGRLGNFINGELYGRMTDASIGMVFPLDPYRLPRHPSQLYEAFFEGLFLFVVLWNVRKMKWSSGTMLSFYLIGYGTVRFFIEFYREPDTHLGFIFLFFSMGQILCSLMVAAGISLFVYLKHKE